MSNGDDQKRHISRVISAIRDDDLPGNEPSQGSEPDLDDPNYRPDEVMEDEYYADEEERRQWDYDEANANMHSGDDENESRRSQKGTSRSAGWGLLLDWRLVAALAILVAGLFMVNFSGDDDEVVQSVTATPVVGGDVLTPEGGEATPRDGREIARLEARITALEQRLAASVSVGASGTQGADGTAGAGSEAALSGNVVTKDELQVLRDQVNAGLKAQQDATRTAVRDSEQRLTRLIDTKVAAASSAAPAQASSAGSPSQPAAAAGGWFVNVATYSQRGTADAMVKRLQEAGHSAAIAPATIGGEPSFRVRVTNLPSRDAAQSAARELESQLGIRGLWVGES